MTTTTARRSRAGSLAWMSRGVCLDRGDLPWIAEPEQTTAWERLTMGALCQNCPVRTDCAGCASREKVTAGFWAGRHRDAEVPNLFAGPGWAVDPQPGLGGLGGLGGAA
jgi:hypothetical protein